MLSYDVFELVTSFHVMSNVSFNSSEPVALVTLFGCDDVELVGDASEGFVVVHLQSPPVVQFLKAVFDAVKLVGVLHVTPPYVLEISTTLNCTVALALLGCAAESVCARITSAAVNRKVIDVV
jgi:hypothetical protein